MAMSMLFPIRQINIGWSPRKGLLPISYCLLIASGPLIAFGPGCIRPIDAFGPRCIRPIDAFGSRMHGPGDGLWAPHGLGPSVVPPGPSAAPAPPAPRPSPMGGPGARPWAECVLANASMGRMHQWAECILNPNAS